MIDCASMSVGERLQMPTPYWDEQHPQTKAIYYAAAEYARTADPRPQYQVVRTGEPNKADWTAWLERTR